MGCGVSRLLGLSTHADDPDGDGAQHFSANPITADNGDITLVTMEELEILKPDDLKPSPSPYSGHSKDMST